MKRTENSLRFFVCCNHKSCRRPDNPCAAVTASVAEVGFADSVTVTCDTGHYLITSGTYPDHALMTGITETNEKVPIPIE